MRKRHFFWRGVQLLVLVSACSWGVAAQTPDNRGLNSLVLPAGSAATGGVGYKELYCAGYVRRSPLPSLGQLVGGEQEQEQRIFGQGDYVYLNFGAQQSVRVGQQFAIIRPRGTVRSKFTNKGALGVYVQEVGQVRVVAVKEKVSVAVVETSCETMLLGDLVTDVPQRAAALPPSTGSFNRFAEPSGKAVGRIVLARDGQELLTSNQVVFIDLGAEDRVQAGDRLTIFRPAGTGNLLDFRDEEIVRGATGDFGSDRYKGGKFSNAAPRSKESSPGVYDGRTVTTPQVKGSRPTMPRKLVGEMVVLSVQERTATAIITRVAQEVHPGDFVEVQ